MCLSWVRQFVRTAYVIAFIALPVLASAQDATITGTVTDTTGGVLPGVTVTVVHEASGISFESRSPWIRRCGSRITAAASMLRQLGGIGPTRNERPSPW